MSKEQSENLPGSSVDGSLGVLVHNHSFVLPFNFDLDFVAMHLELLVDLLQKLPVFGCQMAELVNDRLRRLCWLQWEWFLDNLFMSRNRANGVHEHDQVYLGCEKKKRNKYGKLKKSHIKMEHCWQIRRRRWKVKMWATRIANDANRPDEAEETCNCVESRNVQLLEMIRFFSINERSLFFNADSVFSHDALKRKRVESGRREHPQR